MTLKDILTALRLKRGALFVIDSAHQKAVLQVGHGLPAEDLKHQGLAIFKDNQLRRHLIEDDAAVIPEPTFPAFQVKYLAKGGRIIPWLFCFLITFKGKGVGFFALDIPLTRKLSEHELHLLGSLGNFLGGAIENTQLMKSISRHRQDLRRLTKKLFATPRSPTPTT